MQNFISIELLFAFVSSAKIAMQELLQYIFNKDSIDARESLHESLIETVLSITGRYITINTIVHEIERQLGIIVDANFVNQALNSLINQGIVKKTDKNEFFLDGKRKKIIDDTIQSRKSELAYFEKNILQVFKDQTKGIKIEREELILDLFYHFCFKWFSLSSDLLLNFLQCNGLKNGFAEYAAPEQILADLLITLSDKNISLAVKRTFEIVFQDSRISNFLSEVARNYLYFRLLNLEPTCKNLQKDAFSEKIVFLDNNFIMSLVLPNRISHSATLRCLNISKQLGVQFRYSKRTRQEFLDQLEQSKERFKLLKNKRLDILSAIDDDFIADYAIGAQKGKRTDWDSYCIQFKLVDSLLKSFQVQEFSDFDLDLAITSSSSFAKITDIVTVAALGFNNLKNKTIAEHDAYHLLLIRKLREKSTQTLFGPNFWFLTFDQSLLKADKEINSMLGVKELPSSVECWAWMNMVSPFFAGTIAQQSTDDAFVYLMKTNFRSLPSRIKTKKLIQIAQNVNLDSYTTEEVTAIVDDAFTQALSGKIEQAKWIRNKEMKNVAENDLEKRVKEVVSELKQKRPRKEEPIVITIARIACVMIAIIFVGVATYSYLAFLSYTGALIFSLFSVLFMAMAIGFKQIELFVKDISLKLKK